jgi:hypothetical protein
MKYLFILLVILNTARADLSNDLDAFFTKPQNTSYGKMSLDQLVLQVSKGDDATKKRFQRVINERSSNWAEAIKALAANATDSTKDKTLVAEMKRSYSVLLVLKTDPSKTGEAVRALVSLRSRVPSTTSKSAW